MKKGLIVSVATLIALAIVLAVAVTVGTPVIVRTVLASVSSRSGMTVEVGGINGSLFSPLVLENVTVVNMESDTIFSAAGVNLSYRLFRLIRGKLEFQHVALDNPRLQIKASQTNTENQTGAVVPDIAIQRLDIADGDVHLVASHASNSVYHSRDVAVNATALAVTNGGTSITAHITQLQGNLVDPQMGLNHFEGVISLNADTIRIDAPHIELVEAMGSLRGWLLASDVTGHHDIVWTVTHLTPVDVPVTPSWVPQEPFMISGLGRVTSSGHSGRRITSDSVYIGVGTTDMRVIARGGINFGPDSSWTLSESVVEASGVPTRFFEQLVDPALLTGAIDARIAAVGPPQLLEIDGEATFTDARDRASSNIAARGQITVTDPANTNVRHLRIGRARIDLRTLKRFVDVLPNEGALTANGDLSGHWQTPVFRGVVSHTSANWPASSVHGEIRGLEYADLEMDSIQPALIHAISSPNIPLPGTITGQIEIQRSVDSLQLVTVIQSARAGLLEVTGDIVFSDSGTSMNAVFALSQGNANALDSIWPVTMLSGNGTAWAWQRDNQDPIWGADLTLDSSTVEDLPLDRFGLGVRQARDIITIDSLTLHGFGLSASASGALDTGDSAQSNVDFVVRTDSVHQLLTVAKRWVPETLDSLDGAIAAEGMLTGSRQRYSVTARVEGSQMTIRNVRSPRLVADIDWESQAHSLVSTTQIDSISVGNFVLTDARLNARGTLDSIVWIVQGERPQMGSLYSRGEVLRRPGLNRVRIDSVAAPVGRRTWSLLQPTEILLQDSTFSVDSLVLRVPGRDARLEINGVISPTASSRLTGRLDNVRLEDFAAFIGRDSATAGGLVDATFDVTGSLREPVVNAVVDIASPRVRANSFTSARSSLVYRDGQLRGDLQVDNDSIEVARLAAQLPMSLQLAPFSIEKRDDALTGSLQTTSAPLSVLVPFFPTWRQPEGVFVAQAQADGSWDQLHWSGGLAIQDGRMGLPDLGIRLDSVNMQLDLRGDTVAIERFVANSGTGTIRVTGRVGLRDLTNPVFAINATTDRFTAMDLRDYMTMVVTGQVRLTGSFDEPLLTGLGVANRGSMSFADVLEKQIVDLRDPLFARYIDTSTIRQEGLEGLSTSQLLRRLTIDGLQVDLGNDFWMRSGEGDVQLTGILSIDKQLEIYRVDGTLNAVRGDYRLQLAPGVTREFTVTRGTVRYFGTNDLNADLDIEARHIVRTFGGSPVNIFARLGGTLYNPTVQLSSDIRPAVSDAELISYLLFGSPSVQAFAGQGGTQSSFLFQESVDQFAAALSGQLAQSVVRGLGLPLDYLQIKPGEVSRSFSGTEIALGKQFSLFNRPAFITASPRICPRQSFFSTQNLGASLESRLSGFWSLSASVDPVRVCETAVAPLSTRYQLGVDVIWEKR